MKVFLIGISGIGMQGLAAVLKKNGNDIYGFDDASELESLKNIGIFYQNIIPDNTDYIIFSSGISPTHRLMQEAVEKKIPCINRTDFWINHMRLNEQKILVAAAHGKTTTTSMAAYLLDMKSYMIGGIINGYPFPASHIKDKYTVIETDESDGSFIKWHGAYKILLNFDYEHMDFFKTEENAEWYYKQFANNRSIDKGEKLIIDIETKKKLNINGQNIITPDIITFGKYGADFIYHDIEFAENGLYFQINNKEIFLPLLGEHNASNFTAVYSLCIDIGMQHDAIAKKIAQFPGIKKRGQKIMEKNGHIIYSDYGHHPVEIKAVLDAYWLHKKQRPDLFIELHRYTRLAYTWDQWPEILKNHKVFITKMHTANEAPIKISSKISSENINEHTFIKYLLEYNIDACYIEDFTHYNPTNTTICFSAGKLSSILDKSGK